MKRVLHQFPNLNPFGKLKQEFYKRRSQNYLAPFKSSISPILPNEDRVEFIASVLLKVFNKMQEIRDIAVPATNGSPANPPSGNEGLELPNTVPDRGDQLVTGCRCFCNKQLTDICQAYQPTTPAILQSEPRGKSISNHPSSTPVNIANEATTTTRTTETTLEIFNTTVALVSNNASTEDMTTENSTPSNNTTESTTILNDSTVGTTFTETIFEITGNNNATHFLEVNDAITPNDDNNITVIYASETYQTFQAYAGQNRNARSIIDTIPQLSEQQAKLKVELENLRTVAKKIIAMETNIANFAAEADIHSNGEDGVGPWLQKLAWFSAGTDSFLRSSKYSDKIQELLESASNEERVYFLTWKLIEHLQTSIPGVYNPHTSNSTLCLANIFKYFPQYFYPEIPKNISNQAIDALKQKEDSAVVITKLETLEEKLFDPILNVTRNTTANFIQSFLAVNQKIPSQDYEFLRDEWAKAEETENRYESRTYLFYKTLQMYSDYMIEFIPDNFYLRMNENNPVVVNTELYNMTQAWVLPSNRIYNVEKFGNLNSFEMFSIEEASKMCSSLNWNIFFNFTCIVDV